MKKQHLHAFEGTYTKYLNEKKKDFAQGDQVSSIYDPMQEQFEKRCIYQTWIYLWSAMYSYIDPCEKNFRNLQLM